MKTHVTLLVLVVYLINFISAEENEAVVTLNSKNFKDFLKENKYALVEFYAPWCGHCNKLKPEYEKAAQILKKHGLNLAKVDATVEKELTNKYGVQGYPTLFFFVNGIPKDYKGGRTTDEIVDWMLKMTGSALDIIEDSEVKEKVKNILAFVLHTCTKNSTEYQKFYQVADKSRGIAKFYSVINKDCEEKLTCYRPKEAPLTIDIREMNVEEIITWLNKERFPFFGAIDGDNYADYDAQKEELVWFAGKKTDYEMHEDPIRTVAKLHRDKYYFVWLDVEKFGSHAENFLGLDTLPGLVLKPRDGGRFLYSHKEFHVDKLKRFFEDIAEGKLKRTIKSEPIPEVNDEPVKVVVGDNFEEMVFQEGKDVLLEIYAPWCGHCKKLEGEYLTLAEKVKNLDHIVIAKMDGTKNEPPSADFHFRGFPTIFWIKAGEKVPMTYDGARSTAGLLDWLKKYSSKPVNVELLEDEVSVADEEDEGGKDEL